MYVNTCFLHIFFRLLNLFEIFKGKYCEVLKFYFCIRNDSYLLIFEFYIGLMLQCNLTYFLFYSILGRSFMDDP